MDSLYEAWANIGVSFSSNDYHKDSVDPELLICKSSVAGRKEPRIMWAALTFLVEYSYLINPKRVINFLKESDPAVIGALIDIAVEKGADRKLLTVKKKCSSKKEKELLFPFLRKNADVYANEIQFSDKKWENWGLFSTECEIKKDALRSIDFIFGNNKLLAIRSLVGANVKAEIIYYLYKNVYSYANKLSKDLGFSYLPVYRELKMMIKSGYLDAEKIGNTFVVTLNDKSRLFLNSI